MRGDPVEINISLGDEEMKSVDRSMFQTHLIKLLQRFGVYKGQIDIGITPPPDEDSSLESPMQREKERLEQMKAEQERMQKEREAAMERARREMERKMLESLRMPSMPPMPMYDPRMMYGETLHRGEGYCDCEICRAKKSGKLKPNKALVRYKKVYLARHTM